MSQTEPVKQESVSGIWDMFTALANLYVQDRQAERDNAAAYNLYAYNALAGANNSQLQNIYAQPVGTAGGGGTAQAQTVVGGVSISALVIGGLVLAAVLLAVK